MEKFAITAIVVVLLQAQAELQRGTGSVNGTVLAYDTYAPVANARVTIGRPTSQVTTVAFQNWLGLLTIPETDIHAVTDNNGRFQFPNLPPGDYIVAVAADGYTREAKLPGAPPQYSNFATRLTIRSGESLSDIALSLVPLGRITVVVRGADRQPIQGAVVHLGRVEYSDGRRKWDDVEIIATQERGEHTFSELSPGDYYVAVIPNRDDGTTPSNERSKLQPTFFPNALNFASASPINISVGSELRVDVEIPAEPILRSISGRVLDGVLVRDKPPRPGWVNPESVVLVPQGDNWISNSPLPELGSDISPSGEFQIKDVVPGRYDLYVVSRQTDGRRPWSTYGGHLVVDTTERDVANVTVAYDSRSAERVLVKILGLNGSTPHVYRASLRPRKESALRFIEHLEGEPPQDGAIFEFTDITPGIYDLTIAFRDSDNFYVADIRQAGRSIFDSGLVIGDVARPEPVELVVGSPGGKVNVRVQGDRGRSGLLVLVPDVPRREKGYLYRDINITVPSQFTFEGVAPGTYNVFAIESRLYDPYQGASLNAEFLRRYEEDGVSITVRNADVVNVQLNLLRK